MKFKTIATLMIGLSPMSVAASPTPDSCKVDPLVGGISLMEFGIQDVVNGPVRSYQIVKSYTPPPNTPAPEIRIVEKHRFYIEYAPDQDGYVNLNHMEPTTGGNYQLFATAVLSLDSSSLWMRGRAILARDGHVDKKKGDIVGEYFVYRRPDPGSTFGISRCQRLHGTSYPRTCTRLHLEYYQFNDTENLKHRPVINYNIFPWDKLCKSNQAQTGSGDGDEGPD